MQNSQNIYEEKRLNIHLPYDLIISFLGIFPREMKWYVHITETIQHPPRAFTFHRVLILKIVVCPYNETPLTIKKECTCYNMGE